MGQVRKYGRTASYCCDKELAAFRFLYRASEQPNGLLRKSRGGGTPLNQTRQAAAYSVGSWGSGSRSLGPGWAEQTAQPRGASRQGSRQSGRAAVGTYMGESAEATAMFEDERERFQWASQYRDVHAPLPHVYQSQARSRPKDSVVAGEWTSPHNLTYEEKVARGGESRILATQEFYGSTLDMAHRPGHAGPGAYQRTSEEYGKCMLLKTDWIFRPHFAAQTPTSMQNSQIMHKDFMERFCPTPNSTFSAEYFPEGNNTRNAWPRNVDQVGGVVFKKQQTDTGHPIYNKDHGAAYARATPDTGPRLNEHFRTHKALLDDSTVRQAWADGMYHQSDEQTSMRTVSADSPAWFQLPGVSVSKLNTRQLRTLQEWKAPVPRASLDTTLKNHLHGAEDRARMYAKHQTCPLFCSHEGCSQAKAAVRAQMAARAAASAENVDPVHFHGPPTHAPLMAEQVPPSVVEELRVEELKDKPRPPKHPPPPRYRRAARAPTTPKIPPPPQIPHNLPPRTSSSHKFVNPYDMKHSSRKSAQEGLNDSSRSKRSELAMSVQNLTL